MEKKRLQFRGIWSLGKVGGDKLWGLRKQKRIREAN
jgi:hypothetical protein